MNNEKNPIPDSLPEMEVSQLVKALENSDICYFRYFPKLKLDVVPQPTCRMWNCRQIYDNMPYSLCEENIAEEDWEQFKALYNAIDRGAPSACAVFRLKDMKTWSRVTITTVKWDDDGSPEECVAVVENISDAKKHEKEISEKYRYLSTIMQVFQVSAEATGATVFIFDCVKQSILVNDSTASQWGVLSEQTGVPYQTAQSNIVPEESKAEYIRLHEAMMNGAEKAKGFVKLRDANGNVGHYELTLQALRDNNGKLTGKAAGIYINITEYQESFLHQYAMTKALSEGISSAYSIDFETDTFRIENINDNLRNSVASYVRGQEQCFSETIRNYCLKFVHEDDLERMLAELEPSVIEEKLAEKHSYYIQYRVKENEDNHNYFEIHLSLSDEKKSGRHAFMSFRRIDEQKEKELEQQKIISSFSSIYFASWFINVENDFIKELSVPDYARPIVRNSNSSASAAMDILVDEYIVSDMEKSRIKEFLEVSTVPQRLGNLGMISTEYNGVNNGWCCANIIPVNRDKNGVLTEYVLAVRGIEQEKRSALEVKKALESAYEAANRANSAKTNFLSNMSHDIRTPINAIIGMTAIAYTHIDEKERVQDCLSKITVSGKHLIGIVNEVLDMSKIESGKIDLNMEDFDLADLVDNLIAMSKPQIEAMNHQLTVDIHGIEHEFVTGDCQRIQQAFMNLMSNAIKYTMEGGKIRLSITEKPTNRPNIGCYEFIVEDNGIGMSKEFQKHLFEPFARADDARVQSRQGTGLGMPITKNIVQMMNGSIKVDSEPGKGTKFTVTIFLALQDVNNDIFDKALADLHVLIADDDRITCESACDMLSELGMKGEWVLTGQEAIERTVQRHNTNEDYFAVILDWKMPGMDGLETTRAIRKAVGNDVPIIIISAYDWSGIEQEARVAGANAFISKPMFKSRMTHTFRTLMKKGHNGELIGSSIQKIQQTDFTGKKVLLVEDNELNAEIAIEILSMANIEIDLATNGREALRKMELAPDGLYDMVFMDIQMPHMNGYEAARAIRSLDRDYTKKVPIVAMTANAFAEDVEEARNSGMNAHVAKPIDFAQLLDILNTWLFKT